MCNVLIAVVSSMLIEWSEAFHLPIASTDGGGGSDGFGDNGYSVGDCLCMFAWRERERETEVSPYDDNGGGGEMCSKRENQVNLVFLNDDDDDGNGMCSEGDRKGASVVVFYPYHSLAIYIQYLHTLMLQTLHYDVTQTTSPFFHAFSSTISIALCRPLLLCLSIYQSMLHM